MIFLKVSSHLTGTIVTGEDHRFYIHRGFDPISIARAIWNILVKNEFQGGSTIEQQLVRVITGNYQLTISRKIREILLASIVNQIFPKKTIPHLYLSIAYFGWQMNGVTQAYSRLNLSATNITFMQACSIIARLKYPEPQNASAVRQQMIVHRTQHIHEKMKKQKMYNKALHQTPEAMAFFAFAIFSINVTFAMSSLASGAGELYVGLPGMSYMNELG